MTEDSENMFRADCPPAYGTQPPTAIGIPDGHARTNFTWQWQADGTDGLFHATPGEVEIRAPVPVGGEPDDSMPDFLREREAWDREHGLISEDAEYDSIHLLESGTDRPPIDYGMAFGQHPDPNAGNPPAPETTIRTYPAPVGKKPDRKDARTVPPKDGTARKISMTKTKVPETGAGHVGGPRPGGRLRFEDGRLWLGDGNAPAAWSTRSRTTGSGAPPDWTYPGCSRSTTWS